MLIDAPPLRSRAMVVPAEPRKDSDATRVVAIDGPSGAGKSTVARRVAEVLGFAYLDTGAMYRAVTWYLLEHRFHDLDDEVALERMLRELELALLPGGRVLVGGKDVTSHLRSREVEARVSAVSAMPIVRAHLRRLQRELAERGPLVAEGRDMTSVVFPRARWKYYLDADSSERARRRHRDFLLQGRLVSEGDVLEEITVRDALDSNRKDAPLTRAADSIYLDTTDQSVDRVVEDICSRVRADLAGDPRR